MQNYERTATGTYRCFIDNKEYKRVEEIPDYGDWAVLSTYPNLDPNVYWKGTDVSLLPTDIKSFDFLKKGAIAILDGGDAYGYNSNTQAWEAL